MFHLTIMSLKMAPTFIVLLKIALMKSPGAGGISVLKNCMNKRYWTVSSISMSAPMHVPRPREDPTVDTTTAARSTAPIAAPTISSDLKLTHRAKSTHFFLHLVTVSYIVANKKFGVSLMHHVAV